MSRLRLIHRKPAAEVRFLWLDFTPIRPRCSPVISSLSVSLCGSFLIDVSRTSALSYIHPLCLTSIRFPHQVSRSSETVRRSRRDSSSLESVLEGTRDAIVVDSPPHHTRFPVNPTPVSSGPPPPLHPVSPETRCVCAPRSPRPPFDSPLPHESPSRRENQPFRRFSAAESKQ